MAKAELGEKQTCPNCGAKFYDLRKRPAVCPKCSTSFDPGDETYKVRRAKTRTPVYDDAEDEEEDAEGKKRVLAGEDGFEEEVEETPELDAEAADEPELVGDDDEEPDAPRGDPLPPGFSEAEADELDEPVGEDDDGVPLLEDDEEFNEDELGEVVEGDEEDGGR